MPDSVSRRCSKCGEIKPLEQFYRDRSKPLGRCYSCRDCSDAKDRRYFEANLEAIRERKRLYGQANRSARSATFRRWYQANRQAILNQKRVRTAELRAIVRDHYGNVCACCGTAHDLSIDHINGDGAQHRLELYGSPQRSSSRFYEWLIRQGFPAGYQTLCRACNSSKQRGARCRLDHHET